NYGQGSSREQAAILPRYLGVKAIIAKGYARLHLANLVNWGILPLLFVNDHDYEKISQSDLLELDTANLKEGQEYILMNKSKGIEIPVKSPLVQYDLDSIKLGGTINRIKN
ncbi:MAG: aconitate hydratase, partial [Tissierellia bacterium]|nr:aconitate hydratase [Tissierellia bacterium]